MPIAGLIRIKFRFIFELFTKTRQAWPWTSTVNPGRVVNICCPGLDEVHGPARLERQSSVTNPSGVHDMVAF